MMAVALELRDGSPWWASTDIWVVPGADPTGPEGVPIAGAPAYLWAQVRNNGSSPVVAARVDFWWADPSAQVLRSTATFIGSANVDIEPGDSKDVLCLSPWAVTFVNGGHECVIAAVSYRGSSVPTPPPDAFNPPGYPEIAQRNLHVLQARSFAPARLVQVAGGLRGKKRALVRVEPGDALTERALQTLGIGDHQFKDVPLEFGLRREAFCVPEDGQLGEKGLELTVPPGHRSGVHLGVRAQLKEKEYAVLHIIESDGEAVLGGYTFVVTGSS